MVSTIRLRSNTRWDDELINAAVQYTLDRLTVGRKVLISSKFGLNRAGIVTALVYNRLTGNSIGSCISTIQKQRQGSLTNQAFLAYLISF